MRRIRWAQRERRKKKHQKYVYFLRVRVKPLGLVSAVRQHNNTPPRTLKISRVGRIFKSYSLANSNQTELCTRSREKIHIVGEQKKKTSNEMKLCEKIIMNVFGIFTTWTSLSLSRLSQTFPNASFSEVFLSLSLSLLSVDIDGNVGVLRRKTLWTFQS